MNIPVEVRSGQLHTDSLIFLLVYTFSISSLFNVKLMLDYMKFKQRQILQVLQAHYPNE